MTKETAFRSSDPAVIEAFVKYNDDNAAVILKRDALRAEIGRGLMATRLGFAHGTQIVGFERLESDTDGDLLNGGALIVSSKRGANKGMVVPNSKRKAGQAFAGRLRALETPRLGMPGMPEQHLYASPEGLRSASPGLWIWEDVVYALWPTDTVIAQVGDNWEQIPLSTYHLAMEQHQAALAASAEVSGNSEVGCEHINTRPFSKDDQRPFCVSCLNIVDGV